MTNKKKDFEIKELLKINELNITRIYNEKWLSNKILESGVQIPGLALTGYTEHIRKGQIQIFGKSEIGYLSQLSKDECIKHLKSYLSHRVPGIIVAENNKLEDYIALLADKFKIPILVSSCMKSILISRLLHFLYSHFTEKIRINGVLMDVMGLGILITGESGIGKSETALELVHRGHRLITDDLAEFYLNPNDEPVGKSIDIIKKWIEVRGLGILNIVDLFGAGALLDEKKLDLVINLEKWNPKKCTTD